MSHYLQKLTAFFNKFLGHSEHKISERMACMVIGQVYMTQRYARQPHGGLNPNSDQMKVYPENDEI